MTILGTMGLWYNRLGLWLTKIAAAYLRWLLMETLVLDSGNKANIRLCADVVKQGGLIAFPTETVYGLGANALEGRAVAGIFSTKGRQEDNPLIVHVASQAEVEPLVSEVSSAFTLLAEAFWPGPLTLVMKKSDKIPDNVTAGLDTVAVRMPDHPAALALIQACGCPIAAPSANPSGRPSPTTAAHVLGDLSGKIQYILDGGDCRVGLESTVLDLTSKNPRILRPGGVTYDELVDVLGMVEVYGPTAAEAPRSPGMKYRHYAPKAPVTAILGPPEKTAGYIREHMGSGSAALVFDDYGFTHPFVVTYGSSGDHDAQAARLFGALRAFDEMDVSQIFAQTPVESGLGLAVANRIKKAAGSRIVDLSD